MDAQCTGCTQYYASVVGHFCPKKVEGQDRLTVIVPIIPEPERKKEPIPEEVLARFARLEEEQQKSLIRAAAQQERIKELETKR